MGLGHLADLFDDDGAVAAGVGGNLADGLLKRPHDDFDAQFLVASGLLAGGVEGVGGPQTHHAAARHDAFLDGGPCGVHGVLDAGLLLLDLGLGGAAGADDGHAARQFGQAFLEFLAVVVAGGGLDLLADLGDAFLDGRLLAAAGDDGARVLVDNDACGGAELVEFQALEAHAQVLADKHAAGQHGDVAEDGLAAIAEAGRLDGTDLQDAAEPVDDQGRQRLALHVLGDDEQRLVGRGDALQERDQVAQVRQFLLVDENAGVLQHRLHRLRVGDEVRAEVPLVELHALGQVEDRLGALAFLNGHDAVVADLVERVGDEVADGRVAVGADGGHLGDFIVPLEFSALVIDGVDCGGDGQVDAALQRHRVGAGRHVAEALVEDGLGQDDGGGGAVAGHVGSLRGHLVRHLGAHVLELVGQFDFLGDGHAVLRDGRPAVRFLDDDVAAGGAERDADGVGQFLKAGRHLPLGVVGVQKLLGHGFSPVGSFAPSL